MKKVCIMLCMWGYLGSSNVLVGMEKQPLEEQQQEVVSLQDQCCTYLANNITALPSVNGVIDWGKVEIPDQLRYKVLSQVPLDSEHMWPFLKNVLLLKEEIKIDDFEKLVTQSPQFLLGASCEVMMATVLRADETLEKLDLSFIKHDLPCAIFDEKFKDSIFPSSVVQYQAILRQPPEIERDQQKVQIDEQNQLIVSSQDQQRASFPLDRNAVISALQFSDDKKSVIAGFQNGSVCTFNLDAQDEGQIEVVQHSLAIGSVGMNADKTVLAYAPVNRECLLRGLQVKTSIKFKQLKSPVKQIIFADNNVIKFTLFDDTEIERPVPYRYLIGDLTNKELLLAYVCKKMVEDTSVVLSEDMREGINVLINESSLFEETVRKYMSSVLLREK